MSRVVELVFPAPNNPLSINEANRMHWAAKRRRLEPWRDAAQYAWLAASKDHKYVKNKPCLVEIHLPFGDKRRRDPHNYSSTVQKVLIDALVRKTETLNGKRVVIWDGCWEDDNPDWVRTVEPVLYQGSDCKIRITANE